MGEKIINKNRKKRYWIEFQDIPKDTLENTNRDISNFVWKGKQPKVRKEILIMPIEHGGLGLQNIQTKQKIQKIKWLYKHTTL